MILSMVMAMDRNQLIGKNGGMPWHLPSESQYFKRVTMGKPMVMGRKTFDSIGKPLPGRTSIVVTRDSNWPAPNPATVEGATESSLQPYIESGQLQVATSLDEAIKLGEQVILQQSAESEGANENQELAVIGGAVICKLALPKVERLYLTVIDAEFEGDTWLQGFDRAEWQVKSETPATVDGYELVYQVLERGS